MCIKAVDNYPSTIKYVPDRAVNTCSFVFDSVSDQYKTQEMCAKAVYNYTSTIKYVPD